MRYLTDLPIADLRTAGDAIETLIDFRAYTPPGYGFLITLAGKFRDDIRDVLEMPLLEHAYRGHEVKSLDNLAAEELDHLAKAVDVLVGRFTPFMDDPELVIQLGALHEHLRAETARREAVLREEATALKDHDFAVMQEELDGTTEVIAFRVEGFAAQDSVAAPVSAVRLSPDGSCRGSSPPPRHQSRSRAETLSSARATPSCAGAAPCGIRAPCPRPSSRRPCGPGKRAALAWAPPACSGHDVTSLGGSGGFP